MVLSLDKDTYKLESKNFYSVKNKKTQILIGGSLRKDSNGILHLLKKDFGYTKRWPTFTITREGVIYQHFDPSCYSDYMSVKDIDKKSISIVLENMGMVSYNYERECFLNWANEECDGDLINEKLWKNYRYWETYTNIQYESLAALCLYLIKEFDMKLDAIGHNVFETEIDLTTFQGILTRSNYDAEYTDVNPLFDFQKFLKLLNISIN